MTRATCFVMVLALVGCTKANTTDGADMTGGTGDSGVGTDGGGTDGSVNTDGANPSTCTSSSQCDVGFVCNPATSKCVMDLACMSSPECGGAAYCDGSGKCVPATTGSPCTGSTECQPDEMCVGGHCGCEGSTFDATLVPPNVLIVLDRSDSMNAAPNGKQVNSGNPSKWTIAKTAVDGVTSTYAMQIRFGLKLYPGANSSCSSGGRCNDNGFVPGHVFVDPGEADATTKIASTLSDADTCNFGTPTKEALAALETYAPLKDTTRADAILLITDGESSCQDPVPEAATLFAMTPSIRTFVVGFGGQVDKDELNGLATNGGTARPGTTKYWQADDAAGLGDALAMIAGSVRSCTYTLSQTPADLAKLYVYLDQTAVTEDGTNGWDFDPATNQVTFHGASCMTLQSSSAKLTIVYGCPGIPIG